MTSTVAIPMAVLLAPFVTRPRISPPVELAVGVMGVFWAAAGKYAERTIKVAIATARILPEHDPEDPRYLLQGRVGVVTVAIPAAGEGEIRYDDTNGARKVRARDLQGGAIEPGVEVCIERVEADVAHVEPWALVEQRL